MKSRAPIKMERGLVMIYGLEDPRDERVRYIGSSTEPCHRLGSHIGGALWGGTPVLDWLHELVFVEHFLPRLVGFEACEPEFRLDYEDYWIRRLRAEGCELLNVGGATGFRGNKITPEGRRKLAEAQRGRVWTKEQRARASKSHELWWQKPGNRERIMASFAEKRPGMRRDADV